MLASLHQANHLGKTLETRALHRPQWMSLEERYDSLGQLLESSDTELPSITMVDGDLTAAEKLAQLLENDNVPLVLHHTELWKDLPADLHRGLPIHADEEASSPSTKANHPFGTQAFLLITCTDRIVTHCLSTVGFTRCPSI